jgi:plasmid stabilization system protein ParE
MSYEVRLTPEALSDLERLFEFVLERELARDDGDLALAEEALSAIKAGFQVLERFPFTCRKAAQNPFLRELVIPFGAAGYVALFEVVDRKTVVIGAVRHQREDDYH